MKKAICSIVTILIISPTIAQANISSEIISATSRLQYFQDVPKQHHNFTAISWMSEAGVVQGYANEEFKPNNPVNRAELMKMAVLMNEPEDLNDSYKNCFHDVKEEWFAKYVCYGYEQGWIDGYPDGTFKPANNVNRVEAMKISLNTMFPPEGIPEPTEADLAYIMPTDVDMTAWYKPYMRFSIVKDLVDRWHMTRNPDGTMNFYPDGEFTRKEVAETLFRSMIFILEREEFTSIMTKATCFMAENTDTMNETEIEARMLEYFIATNYTSEEAYKLIDKYGEDSVAQMEIGIGIRNLCPDQLKQ